MPAAKIDANGRMIQLDRNAQPSEVVVEKDVQDPSKLARLLTRLVSDVARLLRGAQPKRIDFEDVVVDATATTRYILPHNFGGRVRWWVVEWNQITPPALFPLSSDANTLILLSNVAGTATIRVEEAL